MITFVIKQWHTNFKVIICREQSETLSTTKGRFCNDSKIGTLISMPLYVENKLKPSQLETQTPSQYCLFTISSWESFALFSTDKWQFRYCYEICRCAFVNDENVTEMHEEQLAQLLQQNLLSRGEEYDIYAATLILITSSLLFSL